MAREAILHLQSSILVGCGSAALRLCVFAIKRESTVVAASRSSTEQKKRARLSLGALENFLVTG
jgi:hypothetical protein